MFAEHTAGRGKGKDEEEDRRRFERLALPHLDAAYNLARWLTRNDHDAEDVVQEAMMRAMRYMGSCRGDDAKAWLLQIVRNSCFTWLRENRPAERLFPDEDGEALDEIAAPSADEPSALAARNERRRVTRIIGAVGQDRVRRRAHGSHFQRRLSRGRVGAHRRPGHGRGRRAGSDP